MPRKWSKPIIVDGDPETGAMAGDRLDWLEYDLSRIVVYNRPRPPTEEEIMIHRLLRAAGVSYVHPNEPKTFYIVDIGKPSKLLNDIVSGRHDVYRQHYFEVDLMTEVPLEEIVPYIDSLHRWCVENRVYCELKMVDLDAYLMEYCYHAYKHIFDWCAQTGTAMLYELLRPDTPTVEALEAAQLEVDPSEYEIWY